MRSVTSGQLRNMDADVIILATGFVSVVPKAPGMDDKKVLGCMEAFAHPEKVGQKVSTILHAVRDGYVVGNNI